MSRNTLVCNRISNREASVPARLLDAVPGKYLGDESRRTGTAAQLALPTNTTEVAAVLAHAAETGHSVTVSGARTGISAGAVPDGGILLSLEKLHRMCGLRKDPDDHWLVHCEAGVLLSDLQTAVKTGSFADSANWDAESHALLAELRAGPPLFYAPDPTETGASVGGTIACDASGAHTFRYGATRCHVHWLRAVLADGSVVELARGDCISDASGEFRLRHPDGTEARGRVPLYPQPATKNAAGYHSGAPMDMVDLLIGSEGTLAVITEAEVRLTPLSPRQCGVTLFCPDEETAVQLTRSVRSQSRDLGIEAIEYLDPAALTMLREHRRALGEGSGVPGCLPDDAACVLHLDLGTTAERLMPGLEVLADCARSAGLDPDVCWTALDERERERLRVFRHAVPECVNNRIAEIRKTHDSITKLGTDMAVPDQHLETIMETYRDGLSRVGLDAVIFGHIGDNHVHVNIIPRSPEEYERGKKLYHEFARKVAELNGSVAAEHGIGKLKVPFLDLMLGADGVDQMRAVKTLFDPDWRLSPGTLFGNDTAPD